MIIIVSAFLTGFTDPKIAETTVWEMKEKCLIMGGSKFSISN